MGEPGPDDPRRELADLREQVSGLVDRLEALERRFAGEAAQPPTPALQPTPAHEPEPTPTGPLERLVERKQRAAASEPPPVPPVPPAEPARAHRPPRTLADLEWLVGAKGVVLAGLLILVVAAGLFLKEAWDRGWIDQVPGWVRCAIGAAFGLTLVGVGEVVRRRINPLASSGVSAAGLAIVFGSILAAERLYDLLGTPAAFVLLALTSLAGVAMGAASSRVLLAAFSLIASFVVPLVVQSNEPSYLVLPAYLLALLAMGLTLAAWKGNGYAIIRRIAWWGTASLGTLWGLDTSETSAASPTTFVLLAWAMTIAELVASSRFFDRFRPSAPWPTNSRAGFVRPHPGDPITIDLQAMVSPEARWVNTVFGATAWAAVLGGYAVHQHNPNLSWIVTATLMLASAAVASAISPDRPSPWASTREPRTALAAALAINAAALLAATIALGLGGPAEVLAWALVGLAAVVFGWMLRFHASSVLGIAFIGFALARLLTFDLAQPLWELSEGELKTIGLFGVRFSAWSAQLMLVTGTLIASAAMLSRSPYRVPVAMAAIAAGGLTIIGPGSSTLSVGALWTVYGTALAFLAVRWRRADIRRASFAPLLLGAGMAHAKAYALLGEAHPPRPDRLWIDWNDASYAMLFVAACAIAWTLRRGVRPLPKAAGVLVASWSLAVAVLGDGLPMPTILIAWGVLVAMLAALAYAAHAHRWSKVHRWMLPHASLAMALGLAALWLGERAVTHWVELEAFALLHRAMLSASIIVALLMATGQLVHKARRVPMLPWHQQDVNGVLRIVARSAAGLLTFVASSSEVFRVVHRMGLAGEAAPDTALSVWWSVFAVATIAIGVRGRAPAMRWTGLALLGITGAKVLAIDMAALEGLTRIAGSAVVGLVMLAAGVGYAWLMGRQQAPDASPAP